MYSLNRRKLERGDHLAGDGSGRTGAHGLASWTCARADQANSVPRPVGGGGESVNPRRQGFIAMIHRILAQNCDAHGGWGETDAGV
jgi:hypothetical protein